MSLKDILLVGFGGALGSMARFVLGSAVTLHVGGRFPWNTLSVNLVGCFLAGLLFGAADNLGYFSPAQRFFIFSGILGGFTTFSAFGLETFTLLRNGEAILAVEYVAASVVFGVLLVYGGFRLIVALFA